MLNIFIFYMCKSDSTNVVEPSPLGLVSPIHVLECSQFLLGLLLFLFMRLSQMCSGLGFMLAVWFILTIPTLLNLNHKPQPENICVVQMFLLFWNAFHFVFKYVEFNVLYKGRSVIFFHLQVQNYVFYEFVCNNRLHILFDSFFKYENNGILMNVVAFFFLYSPNYTQILQVYSLPTMLVNGEMESYFF